MKLKSISRLLVIGILLNNIPINSFASVLSEDTRYETFTDNNISIPNILEEDKTFIKIEGDTLVNAIGELSHTTNGNIVNNSYSFTSNNLSGARAYFKNSTIKENTKYTVFCNIAKNTLVREDSNDDNGVFKINLNNPHSYDKGYFYIKEGETGIFSRTITTSNTVAEPYLETAPRGVYAPGGEFEIKDIVVVEGDYSNVNLDYFKGLNSSFEYNLVTQEMVDLGVEKTENLGKYKIEYKATGKNKFNKNSAIDCGWIDRDTGIFIDYNRDNYVSDFIKVKPDTSYTISPITKWESYIWMYDKNYNYIGCIVDTNFTTSNNCHYIKFGYSISTSVKPGKLDSIQIEEGSAVTLYEPYKESINTFYLNSPLLEWDTIEYIDGQAVHVRRSERMMLDASNDENWYMNIVSNSVNTLLFSLSAKLKLETTTEDYLIADKFIARDSLWEDTIESDKEGIDIAGGHLKQKDIHIRINPSKLVTPDFTGFKEWLQSNPVTMVYKLDTPIYEPINTELSVNLFEGATYISNNSNIPATMEVTVDRVLNRAVEYTTLAKTNPTINNLSRARYWNNLLRDSIKKDQLQETVDNISRLNDMELERKTVSSNLDLYIKCENILMMSLSTNSITFEDFSGIEDMIKENAVQISINSSLPYQLNAYLPTEIQNADKSVTMDKDILNIKENSESTYQTFSNTTDKVILKDNCPYGNDIIHGIDIKLKSGIAHQKDVYKTTIKFEAEQK